MKNPVQDCLGRLVHSQAEAVCAHQRLAAACQGLQDAFAGAMRRRMAHGHLWTANGRTWTFSRLEVWVSSNIEFSEPTLTLDLTLRPADDEPLLWLHLRAARRAADLLRHLPLPLDVELPPTLPMCRPVDIHPHFRAGSWKTYPEVTL